VDYRRKVQRKVQRKEVMAGREAERIGEVSVGKVENIRQDDK